MHRCFPEATSVGNGPDEKQHLIPASTSVLLSLVRDWNPGALAAIWNICIHTHLSQLGSRAEKTALSRGVEEHLGDPDTGLGSLGQGPAQR